MLGGITCPVSLSHNRGDSEATNHSNELRKAQGRQPQNVVSARSWVLQIPRDMTIYDMLTGCMRAKCDRRLRSTGRHYLYTEWHCFDILWWICLWDDHDELKMLVQYSTCGTLFANSQGSGTNVTFKAITRTGKCFICTVDGSELVSCAVPAEHTRIPIIWRPHTWPVGIRNIRYSY